MYIFPGIILSADFLSENRKEKENVVHSKHCSSANLAERSDLEFRTLVSNFVVPAVYHFVEERRVPFLRRAIRQSGSKRIARWAITR